MGATTFVDMAGGATAQEAFANATRSARHQYGHDPYSGTIGTKTSFMVIRVPDDYQPAPNAYRHPDQTDEQWRASHYSDHLIREGDPRVDSKWGPAGAIAYGDGAWLFFGWAPE